MVANLEELPQAIHDHGPQEVGRFPRGRAGQAQEPTPRQQAAEQADTVERGRVVRRRNCQY